MFGTVGSIDLAFKAVGAALARVALEAGVLDKSVAKQRVIPPSTIGERLVMGLDLNSVAWVAFSVGFCRGEHKP